MTIKEEIDNLNFIKMKTFVYQETTITQWKDKPQSKKRYL